MIYIYSEASLNRTTILEPTFFVCNRQVFGLFSLYIYTSEKIYILQWDGKNVCFYVDVSHSKMDVHYCGIDINYASTPI